MENQVIILAGGVGSRMKSIIPKVLHSLNGMSFIERVIESVSAASKCPVIVVGYRGSDVVNHLGNRYKFVWQKKQLGTGHAILCAKDELKKLSIKNVIVLSGDHPCVSRNTIKNLIESHLSNKAVLTITTIKTPCYDNIYSAFYNCGRVIRNKREKMVKIIELKDCNDRQCNTKEVNAGSYCFDVNWLWANIGKLSNKNRAKEYYLTDLIGIAVNQKQKVNSIEIKNPIEGLGVNNKEQLKILRNYVTL